jgi:hypothetical protein
MEGYKPPEEQPSDEERRRLREQQIIWEEENRLHMLEAVEGLRSSLEQLSTEDEGRGTQIRIAHEALDLVTAVLRGDNAAIKRRVDSMASRLGYHLEEGGFEGAPLKERREQIHKNLEEWEQEQGLS